MTRMAEAAFHCHGARVHTHPHAGSHRHLRHPRRSRPIHGPHAQDHGHYHGLVDDSIKRSRAGLRAVGASLAVLAATAAIQAAIYVATGSVALLADLIHNFGDALTAVPLGTAFLLRSARAERYAGLGVVLAIFVSACVAGVIAIEKIISPHAPEQLLALAIAGAVGFAGNELAAQVRLRAGRSLGCDAERRPGGARAADCRPDHRHHHHRRHPANHLTVVADGERARAFPLTAPACREIRASPLAPPRALARDEQRASGHIIARDCSGHKHSRCRPPHATGQGELWEPRAAVPTHERSKRTGAREDTGSSKTFVLCQVGVNVRPAGTRSARRVAGFPAGDSRVRTEVRLAVARNR
jgi:hypothetical protein